MIREKRLYCKLIKIKKSARQLYEAEKRLCASSRQACPMCGCRGRWLAHGQYEGSVIDYESGRVVYGRMKIRRVRCESWGHTHAVIPDYIIPYSTYSLFFVLRVLGEYFLRKRAVERICSRYNITPSMLYSWKGVFEEHKEIWLGVLAGAEQTGGDFIRWLVGEGFIPATVSVCAVQRYIKHNDLKSARNPNLKDRKAFEEDAFGKLWQADTCYLPHITENGRRRRDHH